MSKTNIHLTLKNIRHGLGWVRWWREYNLTYWQMISALGFPIPSRIEARWPYSMNAGNPYKCGLCEARRIYPGLHVGMDLTHYRSTLFGSELEDFERRVNIALNHTKAKP